MLIAIIKCDRVSTLCRTQKCSKIIFLMLWIELADQNDSWICSFTASCNPPFSSQKIKTDDIFAFDWIGVFFKSMRKNESSFLFLLLEAAVFDQYWTNKKVAFCLIIPLLGNASCYVMKSISKGSVQITRIVLLKMIQGWLSTFRTNCPHRVPP